MVDAEEAWTFERTKLLASAVMGGASQDEIIEAALAETLTELLPAGDECRELERATDLHTWRSEARQVDAAVRAKMEACFEQVVTPRPADVTANEPAQPMSPSASSTPSDIDKTIRGACEALAGRDLELGRLAQAMDLRRGWKTLGYHSFGHFTRERLGCVIRIKAVMHGLAYRTGPEVSSESRVARFGGDALRLVLHARGSRRRRFGRRNPAGSNAVALRAVRPGLPRWLDLQRLGSDPVLRPALHRPRRVCDRLLRRE